jgi:LytTr DNA-binding domain
MDRGTNSPIFDASLTLPARRPDGSDSPVSPLALAHGRLAFWLGFPVALGIFSGWNQIGMIAPALSAVWSMIYWLLLSLIMWLGLGAGTYLAMRFGGRLIYSAKLVAGTLLGVALTRPVHAAFQDLFLPLARAPETLVTLPMLPVSLGDWARLYTGNALLMAFWIGGSLFFARFVGYRPFGPPQSRRVAVGPSAGPAVAPRFAARLSRTTFDQLEAIQAEDHYIRCFGDRQEELLLYRFADALLDLEGHDWLRVHRSVCVRRDRIVSVTPRGRSMTMTLASGRCFPVSERYYAVAARAFRA